MPIVLLYLYCSDIIVYILIGEKQYSMVMDLLCSALVVDKDEWKRGNGWNKQSSEVCILVPNVEC